MDVLLITSFPNNKIKKDYRIGISNPRCVQTNQIWIIKVEKAGKRNN